MSQRRPPGRVPICISAQICDFGLSKWKEYSTAHTNSRTTRVGTVSHIPPENLKNINQQRTVKFDVYGFAVFMWELFSGEKPFKNGNCPLYYSVNRLIRPPGTVVPEGHLFYS